LALPHARDAVARDGGPQEGGLVGVAGPEADDGARRVRRHGAEHVGGDEEVGLPGDHAGLRPESVARQREGVAGAAPLGLVYVDDVEPLEPRAEVRAHLLLEVPHDQRQAVPARHGHAAREELRERVLEERPQADRVHALLQVGAEPAEARAVAGGETDEVHQRKVTPAPPTPGARPPGPGTGAGRVAGRAAEPAAGRAPPSPTRGPRQEAGTGAGHGSAAVPGEDEARLSRRRREAIESWSVTNGSDPHGSAAGGPLGMVAGALATSPSRGPRRVQARRA